jgi:hypothetical protein
LSNKTKEQYEKEYNGAIEKITPTKSDIEKEIEVRKEQSKQLIENKKDVCIDLPRYDKIFKNPKATSYFLKKLGFQAKLPLNIMDDANKKRYAELFLQIKNIDSINTIAKNLIQGEKVREKTIVLFVISVLKEFETLYV